MQLEAMTTEPVIGPQHIWKTEIKKNWDTINAQLIKENIRVWKNIERQQE